MVIKIKGRWAEVECEVQDRHMPSTIIDELLTAVNKIEKDCFEQEILMSNRQKENDTPST